MKIYRLNIIMLSSILLFTSCKINSAHHYHYGPKKEFFDLFIHFEDGESMVSNYNDIELHKAVRNNDINKVKELFASGGIDVNSQNHQGNTPLHIASKKGYEDIVKILSKNEYADLSIKNNKGLRPIDMTCNRDIQHIIIIEEASKDIIKSRKRKLRY